MINRQALLADLQKLLQRIEADLLERSESTEIPEVPAALHVEYEKAAKAERTAQNYEDWRTDTITQAAAAWVLSCVFVRFLEDNSLIDPPKIAGPGERLARARDEHELYFRSHPKHTDREYLLSVFGELAKLPGTKDIFGEHNAINDLHNWLSGDAAGELLNFFQKVDASTGNLVHDFTDPRWDTRFLGDLYQDLSEAARKKFALLQTPDFVEEFILDRTLEPALDEFGLESRAKAQRRKDEDTLSAFAPSRETFFKMIDPACGSGHFLLGAFPRLLDRWQRKEPGTNIRELSQRALDSIHGVDINPFAVAIAKFRLLLVAMKACDIRRLADAPAFLINVACGDSLLHGENQTSSGQKLWDYAEGATDEELYSHAYPGEDLQKVRAMLRPGTYHCVVANPPYIVPRDSKLNDWYRKRFSACHRQYSLAVPFMQQIYQLAMKDGFSGQITANSFMKREFGKKLIETFIPNVDLTHVIDTSGAYIPGHGTPTVILFGRNRSPHTDSLRTVMGIRGEPTMPLDASCGLVWAAIIEQLDVPNSTSNFVSVGDSPRSLFHRHPWSIGGGGAAELKECLDESAKEKLGDYCADIGFGAVTREDEAYLIGERCARRHGIPHAYIRPLVAGEEIRDWQIVNPNGAIWPYSETTLRAEAPQSILRLLWPMRTGLSDRVAYGLTQLARGLEWFEYSMFFHQRYRSPLTITYALIATHNHFALSSNSKVFKDSAPILKLAEGASEDDYLALVGLLNSSTVCFWMKQVCFPKGTATGDISKEKGKAEANRYAFNTTALAQLPIPDWTDPLRSEVTKLAREIHSRAEVIDRLLSINRIEELLTTQPKGSLSSAISLDRERIDELSGEMVFFHEELDWIVYEAYRLVDSASSSSTLTRVPRLRPADRPFCSKVVPAVLQAALQESWHKRQRVINDNESIRLIETPVFKRLWVGRQGVYGSGSRTTIQKLRDLQQLWLIECAESFFDFDGRMANASEVSITPVPLREIAMYSVAQVADAARRDPKFMEVGELYRDDPAFDVQALVEELVLAESVPHLPILRYKDSGLRKRAEWERTWDLQRREDAGESVGTIPVPPKYTSADFILTGGARYWALRGKLDVPKERWISFPHCEGPDGTLVICWAGYDHLQQAQAISAYYVRVQTEFGGSDDPRLIPLLASLIELLPWLKQWHNEPNANFDGLRMGDYFEGFVNEEARALGKTLEEIRAWVPPKGQRAKVTKGQNGKKKKKAPKGTSDHEGADA